MYKPLDKFQKELVSKLEEFGIETDISKRWESGTPHHQLSEGLGQYLSAIDWLFLSDYFEWKFGGDGDNGEQLLYCLDIIFDLKDKYLEEQSTKATDFIRDCIPEDRSE